jgi:hypothetical protein
MGLYCGIDLHSNNHVRLVNTAPVRQYEGLKHTDDKHGEVVATACGSPLEGSHAGTSPPVID